MLIAPNKPQPAIGHMSSDSIGVSWQGIGQLRPRVVIIGGGFAGLAAARALAGTAAEIVLIDRRNYHLFQPLLYQVATASLSPTDIAAPLRGILRRQANVSVMLGEVTAVDRRRQVVRVGQREITYDYLVVATGARPSYSGHEQWEKATLGLKSVEDGIAIRSRILLALERAEATEDAAERRRLMTFVVVGAGPMGVELAGAVVELVRTALDADFRHLDPSMARIVLVESAIRVLPTFAKSLSSIARHSLQCLGVELRLGVPVSECDAEGIMLAGKRLPSATVLWAGGVAGSPAATWLGAAKDETGRVVVTPDLTLPGDRTVFVIGDTAHVEQNGRVLPGVAPVAQQEGTYVGRVIAARVAGKREPDAFRYRNRGAVATIGGRTAVAQFGPLRFSGRVAWLLWAAVHVYSLVGFRNRVAAMLGWFRAYLTAEHGARLIADQPEARGDLAGRFGLPTTEPVRTRQSAPPGGRHLRAPVIELVES